MDRPFTWWLMAALLMAASATLHVQQSPAPLDWIDPSTGHRIVRLTDDAGGSTLYFHDNAFSPEGDKLMFSTPNGIAVVEVAKIGASSKPEIVATAGRNSYFARRTREIYFASGGKLMAVNVDTKATREVPHARGLINADETLSVVKNANAQDTEAGIRGRPRARSSLSCSGCFPARRWKT